jgi:flagellar biosynthesis component FlhA
MSKRQTLMVLGFLVISLLHLGFPASWDKIISALIGVIIIFIAFHLKSDSQRTKKYSFVEHKNTEVNNEKLENNNSEIAS